MTNPFCPRKNAGICHLSLINCHLSFWGTIGRMCTIVCMLSRFPKTRPVLPDAYRAIYDEHYRTNREGLSPASSLSMKMEAWMHRCVASDVAEGNAGPRTLEIGAGRVNHRLFRPQSDASDVL